MRALANKLCDPVVKSCKRVPTANTTSACAAMVLAAGEPVTPTAPKLRASSHGKLLLPAWVSMTGIPWVWAKARKAAQAWL